MYYFNFFSILFMLMDYDVVDYSYINSVPPHHPVSSKIPA